MLHPDLALRGPRFNVMYESVRAQRHPIEVLRHSHERRVATEIETVDGEGQRVPLANAFMMPVM